MPIASQLYLNIVAYYQDTGVFPRPFNGIKVEIKSDPYLIGKSALHSYSVDDKGEFVMFDHAIEEWITDFAMTPWDMTKVEHLTINHYMDNHVQKYSTK